MSKKTIVSAYYFPNWHVDARNEKLHGKNWTEWRVVEYATPRFPGHEQPNLPLWGFEDEADPQVMDRKISTACEYGIDAWVFDYYYFFDGTYRERCLNEGFLPALKDKDFQFALMWANHNPIYSHPGSYRKPAEMLWSGAVSPETFLSCTDHIIDAFFMHPNYLRVKDKLYFSFFDVNTLVKTLGGKQISQLLFREFRHRVEKAGLGEINLDGTLYSMGDRNCLSEINSFVRELGFDSCSNYCSLRGNGFPQFEYNEMTDLNDVEMRRISKELCVPYNPVITAGCDNSPRTVQSDMYENVGYPFSSIAVNNTVVNWERCLRKAADFIDSGEFTGDLLHLSCWNEWTEGAYLEPDVKSGFGRLEAVRNVFGIKEKNPTDFLLSSGSDHMPAANPYCCSNR